MYIDSRMPEIRLIVKGSPYHEKLIKSFLENVKNVKLLDTDQFSDDADIFYWLYGFPTFLLRSPLFWLRSKPLLIIHWLGSDVLRTFLTPQKGYKGKIVRQIVKTAEKIRAPRIVNLAVADWLVGELKSQGIRASWLPISTLDVKTLKAPTQIKDKDIDFLSYIPKTSFSFYGGNIIQQLSKEMPQYTFAVVMPDITDCNALPKAPSENLHFYPKLTFDEMQEMYLQSKCLSRLTEHDGLSLSVLEALYYKLQVVWTYDFPHVIKVNRNDIDELKKAMSHVIEDYNQNSNGHDYVVQNFSREVCKTMFFALINSLNPHFEIIE